MRIAELKGILDALFGVKERAELHCASDCMMVMGFTLDQSRLTQGTSREYAEWRAKKAQSKAS